MKLKIKKLTGQLHREVRANKEQASEDHKQLAKRCEEEYNLLTK